jgi:ubiquinone biosynthesis protein Coq4
VGRCFFEHDHSNGFAFPGEEGGFFVGALFHDFGHVLAGYDTTPEGELQVACFQAGYRRCEDAFFTILFAVLIHTAGVNVAPIAMPKHPGRIGEGDLAARMIHALQRGSQVSVDLADRWDFWPLVALPLAEVRRRLGVPPLEAAFASGPGVYGPPTGRW